MAKRPKRGTSAADAAEQFNDDKGFLLAYEKYLLKEKISTKHLPNGSSIQIVSTGDMSGAPAR